MFGWTGDKMTIGKSVQKTASEIDFKVDGKELPQGEADCKARERAQGIRAI